MTSAPDLNPAGLEAAARAVQQAELEAGVPLRRGLELAVGVAAYLSVQERVNTDETNAILLNAAYEDRDALTRERDDLRAAYDDLHARYLSVQEQPRHGVKPGGHGFRWDCICGGRWSTEEELECHFRFANRPVQEQPDERDEREAPGPPRRPLVPGHMGQPRQNVVAAARTVFGMLDILEEDHRLDMGQARTAAIRQLENVGLRTSDLAPGHDWTHRVERSASGMSARCLDCDWTYEYD
jgi:hypothetical protein